MMSHIKNQRMVYFAIFVLAFLPFSAWAADGIDIQQASVSLQGNVSGLVSDILTISNTGDTILNVAFSGTPLTSVSAPNNITMSPISGIVGFVNGTQQNRTLSVSIPSNQFASTYTGQVTAVGGNASDQVAVSLTVNPNPAITVSSASANIVRGNMGSAPVTVSNTGNIPLSAVVILSDLISGTNVIPASFIVINESSFAIDYQAAKNLMLSVSVPSTQQPGTYTGTINISASGISATAPVTVVVQDVIKVISVQDVAATWINGVTSSLQVPINVTSGSNTNVTVSMSHSGASIGVAMSFNPASFTIAAGETKTTIATITGVPSTSGLLPVPVTTAYDSQSIASNVQLLIRDPSSSLSSPADISLGSSSTARGTQLSTTFTITNDGEMPLTSLVINSTILPKYSTVLTPSLVSSLLPSQSVELSLGLTVPQDQGASRTQIGALQITGSGIAKVLPVYLTAESKLKIADIDITVDGETKDIDDGESQSIELLGKKSLEVKVKVRNDFPDTTDMDINNINIRVVIRDIDDNSDLDEETSDFNLGEDRDTTRIVSFSLPDELDSSDYAVDVYASGRDDNGVSHSDSWSFTLDVKRKSDDVRLRDISLSGSQVSCGSAGSILLEVENFGTQDQDNVIIAVENSALNIKILDEFRLYAYDDSEDSNMRKTYSFTVPSTAAAGSYPLTITVYDRTMNLGSVFDLDTITLNVVCGSTAPSQPSQPSQPNQPSQPSQPWQPQQDAVVFYGTSGDGIPSQARTTGFPLSESTYIALLIAGIVLLIVLAILMVIVFTRN